ncbi:hypothetical protein Tco_1392876 [Tanacetum coccineum]
MTPQVHSSQCQSTCAALMFEFDAKLLFLREYGEHVEQVISSDLGNEVVLSKSRLSVYRLSRCLVDLDRVEQSEVSIIFEVTSYWVECLIDGNLFCAYIVRDFCEAFVDLKLAIRKDLGFIPSGNVVLSSTYVGKILGSD